MLYSGYGVASDGGGSWSCGNDSVRNVIIFGVDNSLSSHTDNLMNRFLILGEDPTSGINKSFDSPQKKFSINFSKARTKFCLTLHYNVDNGYLFVNGKKSTNLKLIIRMPTFQIGFVYEVYLMDFMIQSLEKYL